MGLWLLVIPIILCILIALHYRYAEVNVVKLGVLSVTLFWTMYSVISGIFFMLDRFSFVSVLITMLVFMLLVVGVLIYKYGKKQLKIDFLFRRDMVALLFVGMAFLLTCTKFELFDTGQDQGLYQTEALELYMGNFEVEHDFEEYQILKKGEDKNAYLTMLDETWTGYYRLEETEYTEHIDAQSEVSGMFHGVQTFPAMMALMGRLVGMKNMVQVQTVFYICSIVLLYYTMCEMKVCEWNRIFLTAIFMLSPLTLWISKASYTEMCLCMFVCTYLYLQLENAGKKWLSGVPLISFAFVHVSFLVLWPVFWLIDAFLYAYKEDKQYVYANILSAVGLVMGYLVMATIAPQYFYMNCAKLYVGGIVTHRNFLIWILVVAIISCAVSFAMLRINISSLKNLVKKIHNLKWIIPAILGLAIVYWIVYGVKIGYFSVSDEHFHWFLYEYYGQGLVAYTHLAIYACAMATGFVILPAIIGYIIVKSKEILTKTNDFILIILFLYIVVLQSVFFRVEVPYYYYYSRYLTYYIPIICLMAAVCLEHWKKKILTLTAIISFCCVFYFDIVIIENKDDTIWEWETLQDMTSIIEEDSAVVFYETELVKAMGPQIRTVAEAAVFPVFEDVVSQLLLLSTHYENVYLVSSKIPQEKNEAFLELIYKDKYEYSKTANYIVGIYPTEIIPLEKDIELYHFTQKGYSLGQDILFSTENRTGEKFVEEGLSVNEGTYSWTDGKIFKINLFFADVEAETTIQARFEVARVYNGTQNVQVIVNGNEIYNITLSDGNNLEFEFQMPTNGLANIELLLPEAVSPQELGQSIDSRKLALALVKASFVLSD